MRSISNYKKALKEALAERDGKFCGVCRIAIVSLESDITIDHINPLSKGGDTSYKNLQLAHDKCNRLKKDKV